VTAVVGCDPGGRETGVVARLGDEVLWHAVIKADLTEPVVAYLDAVHQAVELALSAAIDASGDPLPLIGVEGVVPPSPFFKGSYQSINVGGLINAAVVLGAVVGTHCTPAERIIIVPPAGHGANRPLRLCYPPELIGEREGEAGEGKLRHCRSAWDVAGGAVKLAALQKLVATT
jgi:hypothetical protein